MKLQSVLVTSALSLFAIGGLSSLGAQTLSTDKASLSFTAQQNGTPVSTTLNVTGSTSGLAFNVNTSASWLKVSPTSGTAPASLTVTADPTGLGVATVTGTINIVGFNTVSIPVSFAVGSNGGSGGTLSVDKTSLSLFGQAGGSAVSQNLNVTSSSAAVAFTAQSNASWLKVNPTSGNTPSTLTVTADPSGLGAGTVSGTVTINGGGSSIPVTVTFTVGSVGVSPQSLQLAYTTNGAFPTAQLLNITGASTNFTATATTQTGGLWLQVGPTSGTAPTALTVTANSAVLPNLAAGTYNGAVVITPANQSAISVPVTLTVSGAPALTVNPSSVTFNFQIGQSTPAAQNVTATLTPATQLPFNLTSSVSANPAGKNWISILPSGITSAQGTATFSIGVDPTGLPAGTYTGKVTLTSQANPNSLDVPITLVVSTLPLLNVPSSALNFTYQVGSANPAAQPVAVTATSGTPSYLITTGTNTPWLKVPASGTVPTPFNVTVDPTGLAKGTYSGTITVTGVGTGNGAQQIPVNLTVTNDPVITATIGGCAVPAQNCAISIPFQIGGTNNPATIPLVINSSTGATLNYSVAVATTSCNNWLLVNGGTAAVTGSTSNTVSVSANVAGLAAGTTCAGTVTITGTDPTTNQPSPGGPVTIPVTLTVSSTGQLVVSPNLGLTFTVPAGGQASSPQTISLASTGSDQLNYNVTFTPDLGGQWLSLNATSGVTPGSIIATATPSSLLAAGTYTGTLKFTATGAGGAAANATAAAPLTIPVRLNLTAGTLVVSSSTLSFGQTLGGPAPATQTLNITSNGQPLNFSVAASNPGSVTWLTVNGATTGTTPGSATIAVDGSKLSAGTYNGTVTITAPGASNTPLTVGVSLSIAAGTISATPASLTFTQVSGGTAPAAQTVTVSANPGVLGFSVSTSTKDGGTWLTATPATGTTPGSVSVSVSAGTLAAGTYTGTVTITSSGATGSPISIPVTFTVTGSQTLTATPNSSTFSYIIGSQAPAAQTVQITSSGTNTTFSAAASTKDGGSWLSVTPASGTAPAPISISTNPTGLVAGTYTGTVTVTSPNSSTALTIPVTLTVTAIPKPVISAVGNAASYTFGAVSPGENIVIFGTGIGPATLVKGALTANGLAIDTTAGETQVFFDGIAAPVLYASSTQTSVMVPYGIAGRPTTQISIAYKGVKSDVGTYNVVNTAPGIYTLNQSGTGPGAILNQDLLTTASAATPAAKGSTVAVYMTGEGLTVGNNDGVIATGLKAPVANVTATIGGQPATVVYAGTAPGIVNGVMQVNVTVPANAPSGPAVPIVITVGGVNTQSNVTLAVQ